ncbi:MAG TPA: pirin family protein [Xanthomonadaceae bacterium]|jgi:redox-sensitive bicupin YhaK (pirin superfamily)|nr:pirin family protein [Xanthomonadaceae bacterium]
MLERVIEQRRRDLGGFEVGRVLPVAGRRMVGPFIFFDHMGPIDFAPGIPRSVDVRPHPHIGLSTVTYLFEGEIMHRDSVGSEQPIRPGEVNWMTAGRGITHSERFERARAEGGPMHGIQAWVALPEADEEGDPAFHHYGRDALPVLEDGDAWMRLVAGAAFGARATVRTHSPLCYLHCVLQPGARLRLPDEYPERAVYVVDGEIEAGGVRHGAGRMLVFRPGPADLQAVTPALLMLLGGEPLGPRFIEWNFVSSRPERIEQAKADWRAGRIKLPDLDHGEFIPLPPDPAPPPNPMS